MRAICIYSTESDSPYRGVLLLEGEQTPEEAIDNYVAARYADDKDGADWFRSGLDHFYVHPAIAKRISEAPVPDIGNDSTAYAISEYQINLCAMFGVHPGFSMTQAQIDAMVADLRVSAHMCR